MPYDGNEKARYIIINQTIVLANSRLAVLCGLHGKRVSATQCRHLTTTLHTTVKC